MTNKEMKILDKCVDTMVIMSDKVEVMFKAIEAIQKYIINKERNMAYVDENEQFDKDALLHKLQSEVDMNVGLTDRQKVLFQEDKHVLVDTIIILEDKLLKATKDLKVQHNNMLLSVNHLNRKIEDIKNKSIDEITKEELEKSKLAHQADIVTIREIMEELEEERKARCAAEQAHITAQEEIDDKVKPIKLKDSESFDKDVLRAIGKYEESQIKVEEEGENGTL
tara:strand:- start:585 stop:1256 length:672 start_codon:yes stop_codon:yes gene_type:complete